MKPLIEIKDVRKSYQMGPHSVEVLKGINLQIDQGDFVAIMGPSGSGKSTLMHILGLLDIPTSGSYQLKGREVSSLEEDELALVRRDEVGFIFQQFNLLPRLKGWQNVSLPLLYSAHGFDYDRAYELLSKVNLNERVEHRPNELSGGQQQRVAIARSLINHPGIIFADEPTGNLDSQSEKEVLQILRDLNAQGITIIVVTHEEEIGQQAKRLIRLKDGHILSDERLAPLPPVKEIQMNPVEKKRSDFHLMEILEHFHQGFQTLAGNKVRSILSMLGILIGVAAVVVMLALGAGATKAIEDQLSSLGSNLLILSAGNIRVSGVMRESGVRIRINTDDVKAIKEEIDGVRGVSPSVSGRAQITWGNKNWNTQVLGVTSAFAKVRASEPVYGRFFADSENQSRQLVAIVGVTIVREIFGGKSPIGEMIKVNKVNFRVIGVLPEKGASGPQDQDDRFVVPVNTAMYRLFGRDYLDSVDIEVKSMNEMDSVQNSVLDLMNRRHRVPVSSQDDAFRIFNMSDIQQALNSSSRTMSLLLASIAAISLIVGGIGIMNIMLVSVTERTKEIGLRKAIGARRRDILMQFLTESIVVSISGGVLGILLGFGFSLLLSHLIGWSTSVSLASVVVSFTFSALIGIVFGVYPAQKAAKLHPIDALRYE
jgi:macrolide transport system ATP-binding/permease protein